MSSTLKSETPLSEHDDGDHSQPINLAAPRAPAPVTFATNISSTTAVATQPVTLRAHAEPQKSGLMLQALYIRAPSTSTRPPGGGHVMTPIMGGQVTSSQHFATKSVFKGVKGVKVNYYSDKPGDKPGASEFKNNISAWTVIRMPPTDNNSSQNNTTALSTSNILPTTLTGSSARHIVPPVIPNVASSSTTMASIIKGTTHQVGQVIHPQYSSHVPRGPAAVASITSAPKSAVATPILRAPHSSGAVTLASSVMSPHATTSLRARSPTLVTGRTLMSPISTIGHQQVIDLQKSAVTHSLQTGLVSRSVDISNSSIRSGISHPPITFSKPVSISQPIVQHLQQVRTNVMDKNHLKTTQPNSTPAHQNSICANTHPPTTETHNVCVVPTITRATLSNISATSPYAPGIVQLSAANTISNLRPSPVQAHPMHPLTSTTSSTHQTLTVISAKPLQSAVPPVTVSSARPKSVCSSPTVVSSGTTAAAHPRLINAPNSTNQNAAIPIAKVYPQSLPVQMKLDTTDVDNNRSTVASANNSVVTTTTTVVTTTAVIEKTTPVRITSLAKPVSSSYTPVPPTAYLYEQYQQGSPVAVHPYSVTSSTPNFSSTNQIRPLTLAQHGSGNLHTPVCATSTQPLNSLMVAVESRHITLHPPYNSVSTAKPNADVTSHQPTTNITSSTPVSQAPNVHNSGQQQQANTSNHLSPRPSILRKRTAESIPTGVKRNLVTSLSSTEALSPKPDIKPSFVTMPSPKINDPVQENGLTVPTELENGRLLATSPIPVIKKEPLESIEKNNINENLVEASPRKKPRKQLFTSANELIEPQTSDMEENFDPDTNIKTIKKEPVENLKCVTFSRRPTMSLLSNYRHNWKARHNHFLKYVDVKPKEEKNPTVHELANQKGIMQEVSAWKVYHLTGQMDDLSKAEEICIKRMSRWLDLEDEKGPWLLNKSSLSNEDYKVIDKLTDIVKGNLQRSKIAQEQALESQQQIIKVAEHKPKVIEIINKYVSRRPLKKKEKT